MHRALVTGASGFIGTHLCAALVAHGCLVRALVRRTSQLTALKALDVELAYGDVTDADSLPAAIAGCDVVYHLAGMVKGFSLADLLVVNQCGVENLAAACARATTPPVLINVSSLAAAGPVASATADPRREPDPAAPVSRYGTSKRMGELAAERWAAEVPITTIRPAIVFGEGDPGMADMFRPVARTRMHVIPSFRRRRYSLVYGGDVAEALVLAARGGRRLVPLSDPDYAQAPGYYFLSDDSQRPSYRELGAMIGRALGHRFTIPLVTTPPVAWLAAGVNEAVSRLRGKPSFFSFDKMREATAGSWICTSQRAHEELGFRISAPLEQRLEESARWYRQHGWL
jgi:nucleoside-diphosphate-sugar epimerase